MRLPLAYFGDRGTRLDRGRKGYGTPTSGDAGAAGGAVPKAGYSGDDRAATEAAAAQVEIDTKRKTSPKDRER